MKREEARKRAEQLVAKMTLEEKASQLRYDAPPIRRLNIPAYNWWNEALHGVARAGIATSFPQAIGMAAAFDEELVHEIAEVISEEGRAKFNAYAKLDDRDIYKGLTFWSPNVNIFRDPRWGRGQETYGEDPYLSSRLGVAFIKGLQGEKETMKAAACVKHFAVHSGPESIRHEFNAEVSLKDLRETYLPAFEAAVKEGKVEAVMGAYNRTNGEPCCASKLLMQDILRGEWGFEGHYVSDCWAIRDFHERHLVSPDAKTSAAMALNAGCDLNCGSTYLQILKAYESGLVSEESITQACTRLFTTRYLLGLFEETEYDSIPYEQVECKAHLELSERASRESMVLLKNNGILPLNKESINTIGVIGPNADSRAALIGNYHGTSSEYITILEGIKRLAGDEVRVLYSEGCDIYKKKTENLAMEYDRISEAKIVAQHSDVVVLCLGLNEFLEGEEGDRGNQYASGDKESLQLPEPQRKLMEALLNTGTPIILCMMAGSDIDLSVGKKHSDAIIQAWYPGARGGKAFAELLFGQYSPSGKLCVTFYDPDGSFPEFTDYSMKNRTYRYLESEPQYPFGFGLTYGRAEVSSVNLNEEEMEMSAVVANTGNWDLKEVLQVYVKAVDSSFAPLHPRLCGFEKVALECKEEKEVKIKLDQRTFMIVDESGAYRKDTNRFEFYVGFSQPDETSVKLMGMRPVQLMVEA